MTADFVLVHPLARFLPWVIAGGTALFLAIALSPHPWNPGNAQATSPIQPRLVIVTGGQTGVDRATLDTALSLFLPTRGWCPKGRSAEDGTIPAIYPMQETPSEDVAVRTEWNVRDSDGTLILAFGDLAGGTQLTAQLARNYQRPALVIDAFKFSQKDKIRFDRWMQTNQIRILNVAGPRESANPGVVYSTAKQILRQLLEPFDHPSLRKTS
ncbi:MAG: putative molybdenum carrier protein [Leptolyngbyaceae cyanobacterium bins.349]|nr:putative molybdenum carrier protein [Leptolyngbyaceae cyanobacterium bins.349]